MAIYERDGASIYYEESGNPSGFPVLLIAPGGMKSSMDKWSMSPWNPLDRLAEEYRIIAMDQRNAGSSRGPIGADHGWSDYTLDQLGLMNHLGIDRFIAVGMCIGGSYLYALMAGAPERVAGSVMMQPIGVDNNRDDFYAMFDAWRDEIAADHLDLGADDWERFKTNMFGGEFMFNATTEQMGTIATPILLLRGNDLYHPASTSDTIASVAPHVTYVTEWKEDAAVEPAAKVIDDWMWQVASAG
jgi:pimeloyl-ACP methyl ester carboxylesterase